MVKITSVLPLSLSHSLSLPLAPSLPLSLSLPLAPFHPLSLALSCSLPPSLSLSPSLSMLQVNSDKIYWQRNLDGTFTQIHKEKHVVGHHISTKAVGSEERLDITRLYKLPEGIKVTALLGAQK